MLDKKLGFDKCQTKNEQFYYISWHCHCHKTFSRVVSMLAKYLYLLKVKKFSICLSCKIAVSWPINGVRLLCLQCTTCTRPKKYYYVQYLNIKWGIRHASSKFVTTIYNGDTRPQIRFGTCQRLLKLDWNVLLCFRVTHSIEAALKMSHGNERKASAVNFIVRKPSVETYDLTKKI